MRAGGGSQNAAAELPGLVKNSPGWPMSTLLPSVHVWKAEAGVFAGGGSQDAAGEPHGPAAGAAPHALPTGHHPSHQLGR